MEKFIHDKPLGQFNPTITFCLATFCLAIKFLIFFVINVAASISCFCRFRASASAIKFRRRSHDLSLCPVIPSGGVGDLEKNRKC